MREMIWEIYQGFTFIISLLMLLPNKSSRRNTDAIFIAVVGAFFGFLLWPVYLFFYLRRK